MWRSPSAFGEGDNSPSLGTVAFEELAETAVYVGIPAASKSRTMSLYQEAQNMLKGGSAGKSIDNATLGYIHETGSPANNIPARPFLKTGVRDSASKWSPYLEQAAEAAFNGDTGVVKRALNAAGSIASIAVKKKITEGIPPPIKPATMAARARHRGGRTPKQRLKRAQDRAAYRAFYAAYKADKAAGGTPSVLAGGVTPLVDTGQLLNSITYVVGKQP
jgi:hypothetical protein